MDIASLLSVKIDFDRSHLIFPTIVSVLLAILFLAILVTRWGAIRSAVASGPYWPTGTDQVRFFGTLALTIVYFLAMPRIGDHFPNEGYGFLFCSIPFVFAMSLLYLHRRTPRQVAIAALNAVIAPVVVWYLLSTVFNLTLP